MENTWLVFIYKVPSEPSRKRVFLWRKLKDMGAVYLQPGVGILPNRDVLLQQLEYLKSDTIEMDGEAMVATLSFASPEDEERLISQFQELRNQEYEEICEQCERVIYELDRESAKGKYTFAEVQENEENLAKIHKWVEKVITRDFFLATVKSKVEALVIEVTRRLNEYTEEVYRREQKD